MILLATKRSDFIPKDLVYDPREMIDCEADTNDFLKIFETTTPVMTKNPAGIKF